MPVSETPVTDEMAKEHKLSTIEYQLLQEILGRVPSFTELGIVAAMWSEHCSYKSSKFWLKQLPTKAPWVIQGPGENAGVIDIGDGLAAVFKIESHNHPSFIEPYQGAATGVGGIMRDVFTMGARPIANLNALRFGAIDHPKTKHLVQGVVKGIGDYGNCMGVPTVGGETNFHSAYNGNILVNAMCVGIAEADKIFYARGAQVGDTVVYVGAKTGRDGIRGAVMASDEFSANDGDNRPQVQVGDPFTEKLLLEACLELMAEDAIRSIQDMGAAGLTSSSVEIADKGGVGIEMQMDQVPMREPEMTPYEIMLSESQERMLVILLPGKEAIAQRIFDKWELACATVGVVTDTGRLVVKMHGEIYADLPVSPLVESAPEYQRSWEPTTKQQPVYADMLPAEDGVVETPLGSIEMTAEVSRHPSVSWDPDRPNSKLINPSAWISAYAGMTAKTQPLQILQHLLSTPDLADKHWIYEQYDSLVGGNTANGPGLYHNAGSDAAIVRVPNSEKALAITVDCTPRYVFADPEMGGAQAVAEAWRNVTASGAQPLAFTNNMNFGNPEKSHIMGQFAGAIQGMIAAGNALNFPVISGNVSLYNETDGKAILPTPVIGGVGVLAHIDQRMTIGFKSVGETILLIGNTKGELGQSIFLREIYGQEAGAPPPVDLALERKTGDFVREMILSSSRNARGSKLTSTGHLDPQPAAEDDNQFVTACHDVSDGGLLVALAEMALASQNIGCNLDMPTDLGFLFGEDQARYIITSKKATKIQAAAAAAGLPCTILGQTQTDQITLNSQYISVSNLRQEHQTALPQQLGLAA